MVADFNALKHIFEKMGTNIELQGPAGSGQHTKICNQIALATNLIEWLNQWHTLKMQV